ncbi:MAG: S66 peptidase family protein, partial [Candidatus Binatia bacterium]
GFGAARILPLVERGLRRARPKILVGYSDATAILAFASSRLGWATFHGPMVASDFPTLRPRDLRAFAQVLGGEAIPPFRLARAYRRGVAEGALVGGCLSILVSMLGTPYFPKLAGSLLFLEDVNEEPYQLDRMLTQLRLSGVLARVRGIVFAVMARCGRPREMHAVLAERTADLGVPVAYGLASGHGRGKRTLPLGVRARLDGGRRRLEILETPVSK